MIAIFILCLAVISALTAQSDKADGGHDIRVDLDDNPGVLFGDFDGSELDKEDFGSLRESAMKFKKRNQNHVFTRKQRSTTACNVEIRQVVKHPGHCIRLSDNTPACQTEKYVTVSNHECGTGSR